MPKKTLINSCIFCDIINKKVPANKVYEDKKSIAILDINPVNTGHLLVIPKKHYTTISDLPERVYKHLAGVVWRLVSKVEKKLNPDGLNIIQNNGEEAGQLVPHLHIHLVPRYKGDNDKYKLIWNTKKLTPEEMNKVENTLKSL